MEHNHLITAALAFVSVSGIQLLNFLSKKLRLTLEKGFSQWLVFPKVRGQVVVGLAQGVKDGLNEVTGGTGVTRCA